VFTGRRLNASLPGSQISTKQPATSNYTTFTFEVRY